MPTHCTNFTVVIALCSRDNKTIAIASHLFAVHIHIIQTRAYYTISVF